MAEEKKTTTKTTAAKKTTTPKAATTKKAEGTTKTTATKKVEEVFRKPERRKKLLSLSLKRLVFIHDFVKSIHTLAFAYGGGKLGSSQSKLGFYCGESGIGLGERIFSFT